ncbi:efflux RND transporter permease subunit [Acidobacteriota bacterium]
MKIPEFSVNHRVPTTMLVLILVVLGALAFTRLGLDYFPDIEFPTVSVITNYRGAASEDIENTITKPLEQIISSVSRVKKITSMATEGLSIILVEFEWGTNLDFAAQDIRDQIGLNRIYFPDNASDPLVIKFNLGAFPILFGGITGSIPTVELKALIEEELAPRLERIDGVASVQIYSTDIREILVEIDKPSLEFRNISLDQITQALRTENLNLPAGYIVETHSDFLVRMLGEYKTLEDIQDTVVGSTSAGQPIYLRDVAEVKDTIKETRFRNRIQGKPGLIYMINKRSGVNTVITAEAVKKEMEQILKILPQDIKFYPWMDQSEMIKMVIRRTRDNALVGAILAVFFILVFLRNWRPTITIALAIPLSIITTFIAMYVAGYTINLLTLGGIALGIGMLVDDSIVVIENIFRHMEEGKDAKESAKKGAAEVGMAITASTLTSIAVFFPLMFTGGITGKLTRTLALSITFSLLASLFVALTIVPMLASRLFKHDSSRHKGKTKKIPQFIKVRTFYRKVLFHSLQGRWLTLGVVFGMLILSLVLIPYLGTEFIPSMDRDMLILRLQLPVGTSLDETDRVVSLVENVIRSEPEVKTISVQMGVQSEEYPMDIASVFSTTGTNEAIIWAGLVEQSQRKLRDVEVLENIRKKLPQLDALKFEALDISQMILGGFAAPIDIKVYGRDLDVLKGVADTVVGKIRDVEGLRDVTHTLAEGKPEFHIRIDREKAARLGLMIHQVADAIQTASLGTVATRFRQDNQEIDIRVRFKEKFRDTLQAIRSIPIKTPMNEMILLDQIASITEGEGPIRITRENQVREISILANISGRDLGRVSREIKQRIGSIEQKLSPGYFIEFGGQYHEMKKAFKAMAGAFLLAILMVYMVMASQFESLRHPFVIMFTIPLGFTGAVLALFVSGKPINLPVLIGLIMLGGISVNNGIVLVDYINQLKQKGLDKKEAILLGCTVRLRPVLITALTTIVGMLPMALSISSGSEMRAPMAITVIGGLTATTFLTLFVVPIIYSLFDRVNFKINNK